MSDEITIADVRRLTLNPGDALVLRMGHPLSIDQIERLRADLKERFPDNTVLILGRDFEFEVIERAA